MKSNSCFKYILFTSNFKILSKILSKGVFSPHSKFVVLFYGDEISNFEDSKEFRKIQNDLKQKAVSLLIFKLNKNCIKNYKLHANESNKIISNYSTKKIEISKFFNKHYKWTKWIPSFRNNKRFKLSSFNCSPFVIKNQNNIAVDGVEYRMIKEITKEWPLEHVTPEKNRTESVWTMNLRNLINKKADAAICSVFQISSVKPLLERTRPYSQTCLTFVVPKPHLLPQFTYVFQPLQLNLWLLCIVSVFVIALFLKAVSFYQKYKRDPIGFSKYSTCVLILVRLITTSGFYMFPTKSQYVFRFIITSWTLDCVILTTGYHAGFTSILSSSRYTEPIETLSNMIKHDVYWGALEIVYKNLEMKF